MRSSDLIDFLECLGTDARLKYASRVEVELALTDARIEPSLPSTMLTQVLSQLRGVVVRCEPLQCMQFIGKYGE